MVPIEHLASALAIPAAWAAVHLVLGLRELRPIHEFEELPRPAQLALAFAGTIFLAATAHWLLGSPLNDRLAYVFEHYNDPKLERPQVQFWSSLIYSITFVVGLPIAFLLWHWRDKNVTDQIANARKDINLKEFQEVQLRAAGALDKDLPEEAREQLQIAALHQLRGFLRGEYGDSFKRPAFEMLLAGHAAAIHRIGVPEVQKQISGKTGEQIREAVKALRDRLTEIDRTRMLIIRDEFSHIFTRYYPLDGRRFDLLHLIRKDLRRGKFYYRSHFFGTQLLESRLERSVFWNAHFEGANLYGANLEFASLNSTYLQGVNLYDAYLGGTSLQNSYLQSAQLDEAYINDALLYGTWFDDTTRLAENWHSLTPEQRAVHQQKLRDLGARHVDDPKPYED